MEALSVVLTLFLWTTDMSCCRHTARPLLSCQVQSSDDAIYRWLHHQPTVPLSSVLLTPTHTHAHPPPHPQLLTLPKQLSSRTPTASQLSSEKKAAFHVRGLNCSESNITQRRECLLSLHFSLLPVHLLCEGFGSQFTYPIREETSSPIWHTHTHKNDITSYTEWADDRILLRKWHITLG